MKTRESPPDATQSITRIGAAEIERRQAASVFELLDGTAGVAVDGGPRASGQSFNIRGYTDSEDVTVKVDGAVKGFEKYRYGGTFIEPDLIKALDVQRGPQIESGAGSLGGTVQATTKDAADLLEGGARFGARMRLGYASANDERHRFAAIYGRPSDSVDLLAAFTRRRGDDITLSSGRELADSSTQLDSRLLKASWFPADGWSAGFTLMDYTDQGTQPFDTTGETAGFFGLVRRHAHDRTAAASVKNTDAGGRYEWRLTLARGSTQVTDYSLNNHTTNDYDYRIDTLDSALRLRLLRAAWMGQDAALHLAGGVQAGRNARDVTSFGGPTSRPDGFYGAQPPGIKRSRAIYLQPQLAWGRLSLSAGVRRDVFEVQAQSQTAVKLVANGEATQVRYGQTSPHLTAAFDLLDRQRWTVFLNAAESFRPPLIDEAYTDGAFGRCTDASLSFNWKVPGYTRRRSATNVYGPRSGICGERYQAETSRTVELGTSTRLSDALGPRSQLAARLTLFRNHTDHLLESLSFVPGGSGDTWQPGWEKRRGLELESSAQRSLSGGDAVFGRLSYSRVRGTRYTGIELTDLYTAPADSLFLSAGWRSRGGTEASLRWQRVSARRTIVGITTANVEVIGTQAAYRLLGATLRTPLGKHLELQISGENLENARYFLNDGFGGGEGSEAPGRNLRISLSASY